MANREGSSTKKTLLFNRTNYSFWKVQMRTYLASLGVYVWDKIQNGYENSHALMSKDDEKVFTNNTKAMNAILSKLP